MSAVPAAAQLTCDGTETFEKISGVNISAAAGARLTPLYSEAGGGTVTAQCNNRYAGGCELKHNATNLSAYKVFFKCIMCQLNNSMIMLFLDYRLNINYTKSK